MAQNSGIEWTEATWNPVTGCTKISPGCRHCYAERMAKRLQAMGVPQYRDGFNISPHPKALELPTTWKKPRFIFVNSMSDLFHEDVPLDFVRQVFAVIEQTPQHTYQILTKRPERAEQHAGNLPWPSNVWLGTSVESALFLHRVRTLTRIQAQTRFLSLEPLLGALPGLKLTGVDWVIVGGESGPGARPMKPEWAAHIRDLCLAEGVPFFFKQWGGVNKKKNGRLLEGRTWDEVPTAGGLRNPANVRVAAT
jgi:protein gp37